MIDTNALLELFGVNCLEQYQRTLKDWIEEALKTENNQRMLGWTQNIAVGSQDYVTSVKSALGFACSHRTVVVEGDVGALKETAESYMVHLGHKNQTLSDNNTIKLE